MITHTLTYSDGEPETIEYPEWITLFGQHIACNRPETEEDPIARVELPILGAKLWCSVNWDTEGFDEKTEEYNQPSFHLCVRLEDGKEDELFSTERGIVGNALTQELLEEWSAGVENEVFTFIHQQVAPAFPRLCGAYSFIV